MKTCTPVIALACLGLVVAGCSSAGAAPAGTTSGATSQVTGSPAAGSKTALTVGSGPVIVLASLFEASEKDTFGANGLSVKTQLMTSGSQAVPLLLNGQLQFAAADSVGALTAISKKIPIVIVAQGDSGPDNERTDATGLQVLAGGPVKKLDDLAGKTVAVNALGGLSQIAARAALDKAGVDSSTVKFIEMPIPQQNAAVKSGQVAAAVHAEPYLAEGIQDGLKTLVAPIAYAIPGASQVVYIASRSYVSAHPAIVSQFVASLNTANADLAKDPQEIRTLAQKYARVPPAVAAKIILPEFGSAKPNKAGLALLNSVMVKYKVIPAPVDIDAALAGS